MKILMLSNLYPPDFIGGFEVGSKQVVDGLRGAVMMCASSVPFLAHRSLTLSTSTDGSDWPTSGTPTSWASSRSIT